MELVVKKIPPEFTNSIPKGLRLVKKSQGYFLLVESLFCPNGHNLIVDSVRIHNEASIKLKVKIGAESGFIFIDSFWGSHTKLFSFIPGGARKKEPYVEAFCPYCDADLIEHFSCSQPKCGSDKNILMLLPGTNKIHVCAKLGCQGHLLDVNDLSPAVFHSVNEINFFGAGADELFGGF
jgi:hypothetical protein